MQKLSLFVCVCAGILLPAGLFSQQHVLKINPLALGLLSLNGKYEYAFQPNMSAQLAAHRVRLSATVGQAWEDGPVEASFRQIGFTPEFRFYPTSNRQHEAPVGLFIGPYLRYRETQYEARRDSWEVAASARTTSLGAGAVVGYQHVFGSGFALEAYLGAHGRVNNGKIEAQVQDFDLNDLPFVGSIIPGVGAGFGLGVRGGASVGWAF